MALVAGHVDEELLLRNEYLAAENEILRSKIPGAAPASWGGGAPSCCRCQHGARWLRCSTT